MVEETTDGTAQAKALATWRAILASFSMKQGLGPDVVLALVSNMPRPHRVGFQLALMGAGHVTKEFEADGDVGDQTYASVWLLFKAAGEPYADD